MKRRVGNGSITENPGKLRREYVEVTEHGLGAAHRL